MADLEIDWDPRKAASNKMKNGVTFEEAATAFSDENGRLIPDPDHSEEEERFILLGMGWSLRIWWSATVFATPRTQFESFPLARRTDPSGPNTG